MKKIQVCAAVIRRNGETLVCSRPKAKTLENCLEFPGGKLEDGESIYDCIVRELLEELGISVLPLDVIADFDWIYPEKFLNIIFIRCMLPESEKIQPKEGQKIIWHPTSKLDELDFLPADLCPAALMAEAARKTGV